MIGADAGFTQGPRGSCWLLQCPLLFCFGCIQSFARKLLSVIYAATLHEAITLSSLSGSCSRRGQSAVQVHAGAPRNLHFSPIHFRGNTVVFLSSVELNCLGVGEAVKYFFKVYGGSRRVGGPKIRLFEAYAIINVVGSAPPILQIACQLITIIGKPAETTYHGPSSPSQTDHLLPARHRGLRKMDY